MKTNYDIFFNENEYFIELSNEMRPYFGLELLSTQYEKQVFFSKTYLWWKRTTVFYDNDVIVKVIVEDKYAIETGLNIEDYDEFDTHIQTNNRKEIIPLTNNGKLKVLYMLLLFFKC